MRKYEMLLVLPGTYDDREAEAKTNEVVAVINEFGSEVVLKPMGKNRLAYPIKQVRYGYFYTLIFSAEPENLSKIEEKLKLVRDLLRAVVSLYNKALDHAENKAYFGGEMAQEEAPATVREVETAPTRAASEAAEIKSEEGTDESIIVKEGPKPKQAPLDLKEIDRQLDEILSEDNINI